MKQKLYDTLVSDLIDRNDIKFHPIYAKALTDLICNSRPIENENGETIISTLPNESILNKIKWLNKKLTYLIKQGK